MSVYKDTKPVDDSQAWPVHRIRITLTSRNVASLEKVCADLIKGGQGQGAAGEGARADAHQDPPHHHP
ncbi:hypothetical protein MTO96_024017 [Rhipicephalus appendiculatus]